MLPPAFIIVDDCVWQIGLLHLLVSALRLCCQIFEGGDWSRPRRLGFREYSLIVHLTGLVCADLCLLPFTLTATYLLPWRSQLLKRALHNEFVLGIPAVSRIRRRQLSLNDVWEKADELHYYATLAKTLFLLLVDLALLPFVIMSLLAGFWRAAPLRKVLAFELGFCNNNSSSNSTHGRYAAAGQHFAYLPPLLCGLLSAVLDLALLPLLVPGALCWWRAPHLRAQLQHDFGCGRWCGLSRRRGALAEAGNDGLASEVAGSTLSLPPVEIIRPTYLGALFAACGLLLIDVAVAPLWLLGQMSHLRRDRLLVRAASAKQDTDTGNWWILHTTDTYTDEESNNNENNGNRPRPHGRSPSAVARRVSIEPLEWHGHVIRVFFTALHDVVLLVPLLLLLFTTSYRWSTVWAELRKAVFPTSTQPENNNHATSTATNAATTEAPPHALRLVAWKQFGQLLLDLPALPLALIVVGTGWRCRALYVTCVAHTRDGDKAIPGEHQLAGTSICQTAQGKKKSRRWIVLEQFGFLLLDICVLPLFVLEIVTLVRARSVLRQLASEWSVSLVEKGSPHSPLVRIVDVAVAFPKEGHPVFKIKGILQNNALTTSSQATAVSSQTEAAHAAPAVAPQGTLVAQAPFKLHVLGSRFWDGVNGDSDASPLKGRLPLNVAGISTSQANASAGGGAAESSIEHLKKLKSSFAAECNLDQVLKEANQRQVDGTSISHDNIVEVMLTLPFVERRRLANHVHVHLRSVVALIQVFKLFFMPTCVAPLR